MSNLRHITVHQATTLEIGANSLARAGALIGEGSTLVVTTPPVADHISRLELRGAIRVFSETPPEPDDKTLDVLLEVAAGCKPQYIVGLGGGSVMDMAKLAAVMWDRKQTLAEVVGPNKVNQKLSQLIQIPTTSGTGSEAGIRALVTNSKTGGKMAVESPLMRSDVVLLDPTLTLSVPPAVTAATGIDALAHCVESFTNINSHPVIDEYARLGIKLIGKHLRKAVNHGQDVEAREAMMMASYYGGICLGPVNTAAGHAIAYPLSTNLHLPHGLANAIVFPHVLAANHGVRPEKTLEIAEALGIENYSSEKELFRKAHHYCCELGVDMSLKNHGAKQEQLLPLAEEAHAIRRLMDNNPRDLSVADIHKIYQSAF